MCAGPFESEETCAARSCVEEFFSGRLRLQSRMLTNTPNYVILSYRVVVVVAAVVVVIVVMLVVLIVRRA